MKKILMVILVAVMAVVFVSCSSGTGTTAASGTSGSGKTYDTGVITVSVPDGWQEFAVSDLFSEEDEIDPTMVHVYKGAPADDEMYLLSYPGIQISYFEDTSAVIFPDDEAFEAVYDDIEYIDDVVAGDHVFTAYTCTSMDVPQTVMWNADEGLEVIMVTEMGGNSISLDDPDVMSILSSITVK